MAQRTREDIDAEIARLQQEKLELLKGEITANKRKAREALTALNEAGALSKALKEALTDKRGQIAIAKFFPERE